jgi:hypothetical protein
MIEGKNVTIVEHSTRYGTRRFEATSFRVSDAAPYAQHPVSIMVSFIEPGRRNGPTSGSSPAIIDTSPSSAAAWRSTTAGTT